MAYSKNMNYPQISNAGISSRVRQAIVLAAVIILGMIISATLNAIPSSSHVSIHTLKKEIKK